MTEFSTGYQALGSYPEGEEEEIENNNQETDLMIHVVPDGNKNRWNHIENLDDFFTRVYHYHQRHGYACMVIEDFFQLGQFVFVVVITVFLAMCVDYDVLFANANHTLPHKVTIPDIIHPHCVQNFNFPMIMCLIVASVFWLFKFGKMIYHILKYREIRDFYETALKITSSQLPNITWHEVQLQLLEVQKEHQMCIHKQELAELDIYHRILRFKNYMIAMVNKSLLPLKFRVPFFGECAFLSTGLRYNIELLLFWGPWAPFENNWHLKVEYKNSHKRKELADYLSKRILWVGLANFALCPLVFIWQILYSFFRYAELLKRQPGALGARRWSNFSRLYLRHFNELDHEFTVRVNRGYKPATIYMNIFTDPLTVILAKNVAFFAGAVLAVLLVLTVIDEDVLNVEHILTMLTILGLVVTGCRVLIPDEQSVYSPEMLLMNILAHIHYIPDNWKGNAHTYMVRDEFAQLFQYKAIYLVEELFSPIITPFILCFWLRPKALDIVDFMRNFTVDVVGVGDVCSFAQMDVRKHGNPKWLNQQMSKANQYQQAEDGKTELSLIHFHMTNPTWKPPEDCSLFITEIKEQAHRDMNSLSIFPLDNPVMCSLESSTANGTHGICFGGPQTVYPTMMSTMTMQSLSSQPLSVSQNRPQMRGAVSAYEGPLTRPSSASISSAQSSLVGIAGEASAMGSLIPPHPYDEQMREYLSTEMSMSALYLHELKYRRTQGLDSIEDRHARMMWQNTEATAPHMPHIQEEKDDMKLSKSLNT